MEVEQRQQKCHSVFKEIYTDQATAQFLSRLLTQVMVSRTVLKSHQK